MTSSPMEVWENWQDQTTMVLNNERIRARYETKPCFDRLTSAYQMFYHHGLLLYLLSISEESVLAPLFQEIFHLSSYIVFLLREGLMSLHRLPYNPDIAFTKIRVWILTLQFIIECNWFIFFLCLSFSICKMGMFLCTQVIARRRKYVKYLVLCLADKKDETRIIISTTNLNSP